MPQCESCTKKAYYGAKDQPPRFCRGHKEPGMQNVKAPLCVHEGCGSTSRAFGIPGGKGTHCKKHAVSGMVNVVNPRCHHGDCESTSLAFDVPGGKGRFCKEHATSAMVNVRNRLCEWNGCTSTSRNFDIPGGKGRFCKAHKTVEMVDVLMPKCIHPGCTLRANFSMRGTPARYCATHKSPGMCNRTSCEYETCTKTPGCNYPGETSGRFCSAHKLDGMVNVRVNGCRHPGCKKTASFGRTTPQYCKSHAEDGMRNLISKVCEHPGCDIFAAYNEPGARPKFCKTHSSETMVYVVGKGCQFPGCSCRSRYYDVPGGKGRFCTKHKEPGMVDVQNPKCNASDCLSLATYGIPGGKPSRCAKHRLPGMLSRPRARCNVCRKPAYYGKSFVPNHCELHRHEDDENLMERECVSCHLVMVLDANNRCEYCDPTRFETNRLAKQNALMDYLNSKGLRGNSTDIVIERGVCGRERPDRVFEDDDKIVVLECDEHQHRERQCECEQTRMVNISQSYGGMPVYFIRWNPDAYVPVDGKAPEPVSKRYSTLAKVLRDVLDNRTPPPLALLAVTYMYYDGWSGIEWNVITPFAEDSTSDTATRTAPRLQRAPAGLLLHPDGN